MGERLPGYKYFNFHLEKGGWALTHITPNIRRTAKNGGWALTRDWAVIRDTTVCGVRVSVVQVNQVGVLLVQACYLRVELL